MGNPSISNEVSSIVAFVFAFLRKSFTAYFTLFISQTYLFFDGWLGLLSFKNLPSASSSLAVDQKPSAKHVYIALPSEPKSEVSVQSQEEVCDERKEDNTQVSIRVSIAEKSQSTLWLKIKEIAKSKDDGAVYSSESQEIEQPEENLVQPEVTRNKCARSRLAGKTFLPGITIKLEEYNRKTQDYLTTLYSDLPEDERPDLTTFPLTTSNYSRKFLNGGKNSSRRSFRKKNPPFRPTELSTILETLAY